MDLTPTERTKARNAPEYQRYAEGFCRQFNRTVSGEDGEQVSSVDEVSRKRTSISEKRSAGFFLGGDGIMAERRWDHKQLEVAESWKGYSVEL